MSIIIAASHRNEHVSDDLPPLNVGLKNLRVERLDLDEPYDIMQAVPGTSRPVDDAGLGEAIPVWKSRCIGLGDERTSDSPGQPDFFAAR